MKTDKDWFRAKKEGLAQLVARKPKSFILRELVQNAWDEDITECNVDIKYKGGMVELTVEDDSPEYSASLHVNTIFPNS